MSARRLAFLVLAMTVFLLAGLPRIAFAAAEPTKLTIDPPVSAKGGVVALSATLTGADGKPRANQKIDFYLRVDLLGSTSASVGSGVTDASGAARISFVVTREGKHEFTAKFLGNADLAAATSAPASFDLAVSEGVTTPGGLPPASTLDTAGGLLPWAALSLGVGVWLTLLAVMVRVLLLVPAARAGAGPVPRE